MTDIETLRFALKSFAGLSDEEFDMSLSYWQIKTYEKGDYYNHYRNVCKYMGFITAGFFRSYIIDGKTGEERNIFLYPQNNFVVTFKSFMNQEPCNYHTQALTDARVLVIDLPNLMRLYQQSHAWERFGRLVAQEAFGVVINRTEAFLIKSAEERYQELVEHHPDIFNHVPLYHISSYLGIQGPSLSRIRKRLSGKNN